MLVIILLFVSLILGWLLFMGLARWFRLAWVEGFIVAGLGFIVRWWWGFVGFLCKCRFLVSYSFTRVCLCLANFIYYTGNSYSHAFCTAFRKSK